MFILTDPKWQQGAKLEEYQGTWSIVSARETDRGVHAQWCRPQTGKDTFASKSVPMGVRLGEIDETIDALERFTEHLKETRDGLQRGSGPEDDVPF
jgi:hypothetical protein